jgi:hypothetical protein
MESMPLDTPDKSDQCPPIEAERALLDRAAYEGRNREEESYKGIHRL